MRTPGEAETRVSEELAAVMESMINAAETDDPVTLGEVRDRLKTSPLERGTEPAQGQFGSEESLYAEALALIDEFGQDAAAVLFTPVNASEALSDVLEFTIDEHEADSALTLAEAREALVSGGLGRLTGEGIIEADDGQSILAEIDGLIVRYGGETLVETLLRFD